MRFAPLASSVQYNVYDALEGASATVKATEVV
jgi:hypothetical protein